MVNKGNNIIEKNSFRWNVLPAGRFRVNVNSLMRLNDLLLKIMYRYFSIKWKRERNWEHEKYSALFEGRNVLETGGGLGYDGFIYSRKAASYTYAELNSNQILFLQRIFRLFKRQEDVTFELMEDVYTHRFNKRFQAFYAHGVLHHVPFEIAQQQFRNIDKYLDKDAVVVLLMYPKERWIQAGEPSFEEFGNYTDGGCPWAEYYDDKKARELVGENYKLLNSIKWGNNESEFVNFEFQKIT